MSRPPEDSAPAYAGSVPDPAALESEAAAWRALQLLTESARGTMDDAARLVIGESWTSEAATAYDEHRGKLSRDLDDLTEIARKTVNSLDQLAATMRSSQDDQSTLDEELAIKEAAFRARMREFIEIADRWEERSVRMVNLNLGSGNDRWPWNKDGMRHTEIPEMARMLAGENADIITVQEAFKGDLDDLQRELEEQTGDTWEVHYAHASDKQRFTGPGGFNVDSTSFGNAVLVRHGDEIAGSETAGEYRLDIPDEQEGDWVEPPNIPSPQIPPDPDNPNPPDGGVRVEDPSEGRSAAHAEITFRD